MSTMRIQPWACAAALVVCGVGPVLGQVTPTVPTPTAPTAPTTQQQPATGPRAVGGGNVGDAAGRDAGGSGRFQGFGLNPYDLIGQQSVQQSLNLSQQQLVRLQELMQQQQQQGQLLQNPNAAQIAQQQALQQQQQQQALQQQQLQQGSGFGGNNFDPSQFREFLQPNQFSRFQQIRLQQNPFMLLEDRGISAELALSDEQVRQVQAIERDVRRDIRRLYRERPDDFGTRLNALRSGVFDNLQNVLDQDQRVIWQQLLGEQFAGQIDYRLTR